jgi:hypothetical protein
MSSLSKSPDISQEVRGSTPSVCAHFSVDWRLVKHELSLICHHLEYPLRIELSMSVVLLPEEVTTGLLAVLTTFGCSSSSANAAGTGVNGIALGWLLGMCGYSPRIQQHEFKAGLVPGLCVAAQGRCDPQMSSVLHRVNSPLILMAGLSLPWLRDRTRWLVRPPELPLPGVECGR